MSEVMTRIEHAAAGGSWRGSLLIVGGLVVVTLYLISMFTNSRGTIQVAFLDDRDRDYIEELTDMNMSDAAILQNAVHPVYSFSNGTCQGFVKDIYYVKVHKTASSTTLTLFYNFLRHHNLTVWPVNRDPYPSDMKRNRFRLPSARANMHINFFGEHAAFSLPVAQKYMPQDTQYVASIRSPLAQLRSLFNEFGYTKKLGLKTAKDPVTSFLNNLNAYKNKIPKSKNFQSTSLSYNSRKESLPAFVQRIKKDISVIIIAEYFDESLVLMRRKFCWETEDIVYTVLRQRNYKGKTEAPSPDLIKKHKQYSPADYYMYDFFVTNLQNQIKLEDSFEEEVEHFKKTTSVISKFCDDIISKLKKNCKQIYSMVRDNVHIHIPASRWGKAFDITCLDCALRKLKTRTHRNIMKIIQFPELCQYPSEEIPTFQDIYWAGSSKLKMSRLFCSNVTQSRIPLDVLATKSSYMFIK